MSSSSEHPAQQPSQQPTQQPTQRHAVVGAGAVGKGTATALAKAGHEVVLISRTGTGLEQPCPGVTVIAADASDPARLADLADGAHSLYNCANPSYHQWAEVWPPLAASFINAAEKTGARLISMSNLYGYPIDSSPMRSTDPLNPPSQKGSIRAAMWTDALAAHNAGRIQATELRASDYFGPGIGDTGHLGNLAVPPLLKGKPVTFIGDPDMPHSWSYIDDVCTTLATLGTDDRALGRAWHTPTAAPQTFRDMIGRLSRAAGRPEPKVRRAPALLIRAIGLFNPVMREFPEVLYQFTRPFEIDATDTETTFGLTATPIEEQIRETLQYFGATPA